jgi:hypothetical protein
MSEEKTVYDFLMEARREVAGRLEGESVYGTFPGGDPRRFVPDEESCTPEEIERWREACAAANRAEEEGREIDYLAPGCLTLGDGSVYDGAGLGIGVYTYPGEASPVDELREVEYEWRFCYRLNDHAPRGAGTYADLQRDEAVAKDRLRRTLHDIDYNVSRDRPNGYDAVWLERRPVGEWERVDG